MSAWYWVWIVLALVGWQEAKSFRLRKAVRGLKKSQRVIRRYANHGRR